MAVGTSEAGASSGKPVDVGCLADRVAVAGEGIFGQVVGDDKQDVVLRCGLQRRDEVGTAATRDGNQQEDRESCHVGCPARGHGNGIVEGVSRHLSREAHIVQIVPTTTTMPGCALGRPDSVSAWPGSGLLWWGVGWGTG